MLTAIAICGVVAVVPCVNSGIGRGGLNTVDRMLGFAGGMVMLLLVAIPTILSAKYYWPQTHHDFTDIARPFINQMNAIGTDNDPNPPRPVGMTLGVGAALNVFVYAASVGLGFAASFRCFFERGECQQNVSIPDEG